MPDLGDLDLRGTAIINTQYIESNTSISANVGLIRGANNEIGMGWRNFADTFDADIIFTSADEFRFRLAGGSLMTLSGTQVTFGRKLFVDDWEVVDVFWMSSSNLNVPTSGWLRMGQLDKITFRDQALANTLQFGKTSGADSWNFLMTDATSTLDIEANHTTPANAQEVGRIRFTDDSSTGVRREYGSIRTVIEDPTNTTEDGEMFISIMKAGTLADYVAFNEANANNIILKRATICNADFNPSSITIGLGAPTGNTITRDGSGMEFRTNSADTFEYLIDSITEYDFSASELTMQNNNLVMGTGNVSFIDVDHSIQQSGTITQIDTGSAQVIALRSGNVTDYDFNNARADWFNNNLLRMGTLSFTDGNISIQASSGILQLDVNTGNSVVLRVANITEYSFDSGKALWAGNDLKLEGGDITFDTDATSFHQQGVNLDIDVATTGAVGMRVNNVTEYDFDATVFTLSDANDIAVGTTTGTKIGTATTQKIGFWNTTPVVQPTHIADPTGGATVDAEARTAINSILAQLATLGLQASA